MNQTPKGNRLHIGIFGRRNAGKSSLLNAVTGQNVAIVSDTPGTTADPVEKTMELLPLGPVTFIDTAGIDDEGELGEMRAQAAMKVTSRVDVGVIVFVGDAFGEYEETLINELKTRKAAVMLVANKTDETAPQGPTLEKIAQTGHTPIYASALTGAGIDEVKRALIAAAPDDYMSQIGIAGDLVNPGDVVLLVTPIDMEAPKGRLILPQVQTIRDILDNDAMALVVKERELRAALDKLASPPALVVTDSQAFLKVDADVPKSVPLTSFSILFARNKGDLAEMARGAAAIERLKSGDKILIAEACAHHAVGDDIGRVKLPRWIRQYAGCDLVFEHVSGRDFPDNLSDYALVVTCGSCMLNRREVLSRIARCKQAGVPVTNYGVAIAYCLGIFERALSPFPAALEAYKSAVKEN